MREVVECSTGTAQMLKFRLLNGGAPLKLAWIIASICTSTLFALLGLTAGINLNPSSTVHFVPDWGSVGDWVSGIGALLAVATALWQVHRQQEREKPRIIMHYDMKSSGIALGIVSEGHAPVTILGAHIEHDHLNSIDLAERLPKGSAFPQRLDRGEVMQFLSLSQADVTSFGKDLIRPRLVSMQAAGKEPVIYLEGVNEDYFTQLSTILQSKARLYVKTPLSLIELELPNELYRHILSEALGDVRREAMKRFEAQRRDARELCKMLEDSRSTTEHR